MPKNQSKSIAEERNRRHEAAIARIAAENPMVDGKDFTLIRPTSENVPMRVLSEEFQKSARKVN